MKGSKRRITLVTAVVLGAVVLGLGAAAIAQRLAISRILREIGEQRTLLASARRELEETSAWRRDYDDLSLKLGGRLADCCWSDQMPYMVAQLTGIMEPHGLKIETLQPQPMTSAQRILRFPLRIGLQTDLATLAKVLEDIEETVPLLEVEQLDIRNAQGREGKLQIGMTVSSFVVLDKRAPVTSRRQIPKPLKMASAPRETTAAAPGAKPPAPAPGVSSVSVSTASPPQPGIASPEPSVPVSDGRAKNAAKRGKRGRNRNGQISIPTGPDAAAPPAAAPGPSGGEVKAVPGAPTEDKNDGSTPAMAGPPPDGGVR